MPGIKVYNMSRSSFFWYRIIPGLIAVLLLTAPFWTSVFGIVDIVLLYLAFLATYILYKSIQTAFTNATGYRWMQRDMARNWAGDLKSLSLDTIPDREMVPDDLHDLYHLIFIPMYKEPLEFLERAFDAIASQDYVHRDRIIVVTAVEERAGEPQKRIVEKIKRKYEKKIGGIWDFYHPFGLPGEVVGDACANLRWAGIHASKKLQKLGIPSKNVLFTKFDCDTIIHPKHMSALTYTYLTSEKRNNKFYGPGIFTYSNNYWDVPAITRVFFSTLTLGVINEWVVEKFKKQTFSCYSANLSILEKADYWDASTGAEDTYFYWNVFLHLDGDFTGEPFFLPVTMDAVEGNTLWDALKGLYKQQLRWGWGVLIMPIAIQGMRWNKNIGLFKKISKFGVLFRAYSFMLTSGLLITFAMPVMVLINGELEYTTISYSLPKVISVLLAASLIFQLPAKYYTWRFYGSPPENRSRIFKAWWWLIEPFLMFVNLWTYYLIPRFQAIYELTLGKNRKKFLISIQAKMGEDQDS